MTYSRVPPTCSQWSAPKITGPIWTSQAKNSLHLLCVRSRTNLSTLLSLVKTGGLDFQCSAPFWIFVLSYLEGALWLYISKSVSTLISVQQYSLCSAASLFLCVLINSCCLDKFVGKPIAPKISDSYIDKTKIILRQFFVNIIKNNTVF
jgi:hypothetical protein